MLLQSDVKKLHRIRCQKPSGEGFGRNSVLGQGLGNGVVGTLVTKAGKRTVYLQKLHLSSLPTLSTLSPSSFRMRASGCLDPLAISEIIQGYIGTNY